ncbi:MAG: glucose-1-phosphate cytidylyltransferase [Candidatus Gastranaerophilales bacterium]|nr:glucose-1-phosphate cytidylyltransferase [Candidatus Gastranaerophilales bacterium]
MKVVIFAGGLGTRLSEETDLKPKPMVEIGGRPILWHIMKIYSYYGFNDFVILSGYKSHVIKEYFVNYYNRYSDITVDMGNNTVEIHKTRHEPWKVTILYTGQTAQTGARLKKAQNYISSERFMLTYGDGVADINIKNLLKAHEKSGKKVTMTAIKPAGRFGAVSINEKNEITTFAEKHTGDDSWVNVGFFVCEPEIFNYLPQDDENLRFEKQPLETLAKENNLNAYKHEGFWKPMDTLKEKTELTDLWLKGNAPWAIWQNRQEL